MSYSQDASSVENQDNALKEQQVAIPRQRPRRRRSSWVKRLQRRFGFKIRWSRVLLFLIAIAAVIIVSTLAIIVDANNRVQFSVTNFQRILNSLSGHYGINLSMDDFNRLNSGVYDLEETLSTMQTRLAFLQPLTLVNPNLKATLLTMDAAHHLALATQYTLNGLQPTLFFLAGGSDLQPVITRIPSGERLIELLTVGQNQFVYAKQELSTVKSQIDALNLLGTSSDVLNVQQIVVYQDQLTQINDALINVPDFLTSALGINSDQSYLLLSPNNDELRPSGGYLTTYGWMTLNAGRVVNTDFSPTTASSPNPPPASFSSQVNPPSWWLRYQQPIYASWDGSWSADFPSTARMALWFYNNGGNPQAPVTGALSIDSSAYVSLLGVIGNVVVPGYATAITPDNFRSAVYDVQNFGGSAEAHQKFLASLYQQIFTQWQTMSSDPQKNPQLLAVVLQALQEKHMMMYFTDSRLDNALNLLGWSGAQIPAGDHDYLMTVDTNLGNKANSSITRSLTYDVDIQPDGSVKGHATVAYDYSASTTANDPAVSPDNGPNDYSNLFQIFVPPGTTLDQAAGTSGTPTVITNDANTEFVSRLFIPFDSSERFEFSYTTKPVIENFGSYKRYRLLLQKQPGTSGDALSLQVILPKNATLVSTVPDAAAKYTLERPILEFQSDLTVDRWIEIIYQD